LTSGSLAISVQFAVDEPAPAETFIVSCARHALDGVSGELVLRIVDEAESASLNQRFRQREGPTNVLAFPAGDVPVPDEALPPLGDIVICAPVVAREAEAQSKRLEAHWAHIVIHGCLHLIGYDHIGDTDAAEMETRERELLADLGYSDPYTSL
jgi:probable rRNA maturation factor